MTNRYYAPGPKRSERVRELFEQIAGRYDLINDLQSFGLHRFWKRELVRAAEVRGDESVLDVCCGTGDIAFRMAAQARTVAAVDFTPQMLLEGKRRDRHGISWIQADALNLPFGNNTFHVVTIGYGLRNLADLERGVRELIRVLKPGGRLLVLDFGKPHNALWRWIYFRYLKIAVPLFGRLFCGDAAAYSYILDSLMNYPAQEGVTRLLNRSCSAVRVYDYVGGAMSLHSAVKRSLCQGDNVALEPGHLVR